MAITSIGYDGTIDEVRWAKLQASTASIYGVATPTSWQVSAVAGADRTVSIARGTGWGHHVVDESDTNYTLQGGTVSTGSRWDMVVLRRDWGPIGGGTSSFRLIRGGTRAALPSRENNPGVLDEQPIALVEFRAGQTQPATIIDLRCWAANGGAEVAHDLALSYLGAPGAAIKTPTGIHRYTKGANNVWAWGLADAYRPQLVIEDTDATAPLIKTDTVTVRTDANGATAIVFKQRFPRALASAHIQQAMAPNLGLIHFMFDEALSGPHRLAFFAYDRAGTRLRNTSGIRVSYIAIGD